MKTLIALVLTFFTLSSFAQQARTVKGAVVDLGILRGENKVVLKLNASSPEKFKILFEYRYNFQSEKLELDMGANGQLGFTTRTTFSETYESLEKVAIDLSESSVITRGDDLDLVLEVTRPNKNMHHLKVIVSLRDSKGNRVEGGRKLLGLLGRSYSIIEDCP